MWALPLAAEQTPRAELITAHRIGTTPPMANYLATHHPAPNAPVRVFPLRKPSSHPGNGGGGTGGGGNTWSDKDLQTNALSSHHITPGITIEGIASVGYVPPDTNISVGYDQIVETVNVDLAVYNTSGSPLPLMGPAPINSIFTAAGGASSTCASANGGDPIVLFDKIDNRWIISQLAYNMSFSNNHICMAISNSVDATGSYTAYDIYFGQNLPDYPKMGIWAAGNDWGTIDATLSGVYFSANMFSHGSKFTGARMCGFPLSNVVNLPSSFNIPCAQGNTSVASVLPADLEGLNGTTDPAPAGTAEYFMQFSGSNTLTLYQFDLGASQVTSQSNITVNAFHEACGGGACVPQRGTSTQLDSLADRLMYRLSYRNLGSGGQSMVVTHSVQMDPNSSATGVRWYQLTGSGTSTAGWGVGQEGTFGASESDGNYRWMGSIAQDKFGNLGIGYSVSGPNMYPGLAYTGQVSTDAANSLEPEVQQLFIGQGAQSSVSRWGDYSSMSVDPSNDCTMWFATEYGKTNGSYYAWGTKITSFKLGTCN
jgi:hypothetical protein